MSKIHESKNWDGTVLDTIWISRVVTGEPNVPVVSDLISQHVGHVNHRSRSTIGSDITMAHAELRDLCAASNPAAETYRAVKQTQRHWLNVRRQFIPVLEFDAQREAAKHFSSVLKGLRKRLSEENASWLAQFRAAQDRLCAFNKELADSAFEALDGLYERVDLRLLKSTRQFGSCPYSLPAFASFRLAPPSSGWHGFDLRCISNFEWLGETPDSATLRLGQLVRTLTNGTVQLANYFDLRCLTSTASDKELTFRAGSRDRNMSLDVWCHTELSGLLPDSARSFARSVSGQFDTVELFVEVNKWWCRRKNEYGVWSATDKVWFDNLENKIDDPINPTGALVVGVKQGRAWLLTRTDLIPVEDWLDSRIPPLPAE
jgi:hypothetical protein